MTNTAAPPSESINVLYVLEQLGATWKSRHLAGKPIKECVEVRVISIANGQEIARATGGDEEEAKLKAVNSARHARGISPGPISQEAKVQTAINELRDRMTALETLVHSAIDRGAGDDQTVAAPVPASDEQVPQKQPEKPAIQIALESLNEKDLASIVQDYEIDVHPNADKGKIVEACLARRVTLEQLNDSFPGRFPKPSN